MEKESIEASRECEIVDLKECEEVELKVRS